MGNGKSVLKGERVANRGRDSTNEPRSQNSTSATGANVCQGDRGLVFTKKTRHGRDISGQPHTGRNNMVRLVLFLVEIALVRYICEIILLYPTSLFRGVELHIKYVLCGPPLTRGSPRA